jgi:hypothetical protein
VSLSFLQKYGIYDAVVRKLPRPGTIKGAEKTMDTKIEYEASLRWFMDADGSNMRTDTFSVIDNDGDSYDILLGWDFITKNEIFAVKKKAPDRVRRGKIGGVTKEAIKNTLAIVADRKQIEPGERRLGQHQDLRDMGRMGDRPRLPPRPLAAPICSVPSPPGGVLGIFPAAIDRRHTKRSKSPPSSPVAKTPPHNPQM